MGGIESNFVCIWDGTCNQFCSGPVCNDTYFFVLDLFNCKNGLDNNIQLSIGDEVAVFGSSCRIAGNIDDTLSTIFENTFSLQIIPNPSSGLFNLILKNGESISEIYIYNSLGEIIYTGFINYNSAEIDISYYSPGIYFLKVQSGDKIYTEKVVVQ